MPYQSEPIDNFRLVRFGLTSSYSGTPIAGVSGATIKIVKPGSTALVPANASDVTEITGGDTTHGGGGGYQFLCSQAEFDTVGPLYWEVTKSDGSILRAHGTIDIQPFPGIRYNKAAGGGSASIVLDSGASSSDSFYAGGGLTCLVVIVAGTCAGQARYGTAYTGSSKTLAITPNWSGASPPDATSVFMLMPKRMFLQYPQRGLLKR